MLNIKGIVFTGAHVGEYANDSSKESLRKMKEQTGCNTVVLAISAMQKSAKSAMINYQHEYMPKDHEIKELVTYAKTLGLQIILKPGILCLDGTCHSQINVTSTGECGADGWSEWFLQYTDYIRHYAILAQQMQCSMMMIGCELVHSECNEEHWRDLIRVVRQEYTGLLAYNAERYGVEHVGWWDALDVICSSGYFRMDEMEDRLKVIEQLVKKYNKPFLFGEMGCKSCEGAMHDPADWKLQGVNNMEQQSEYFHDFLEHCLKKDYITGVVVWNWWHKLKSEEAVKNDTSYSINGKAVVEVIRKFFELDGT